MGGSRARVVDVLVVAATNRRLATQVAEGGFRQDLYARFAGAEVELPALRDRVEDIFPIAQALMAARGGGYDTAQVDVEAVELLLLHPWPANVRELYGVLEQAAATTLPPALHVADIEAVLGQSPGTASSPAVSSRRAAPPLTPEVVERALEEAGGNQSEAARRLGVSRGQLLRFQKQHS